MCMIYLNKWSNVFKIFICLSSLILFTSCSSSQICKKLSPCKCVFQNGSIIDLTSIGNPNKARWENVPSSSPIKENYTYYYNPCFAFTVGNKDSGCSGEVAVCRKEIGEDVFYDCGDQSTAKFGWNKEGSRINIFYGATYVYREIPKFIVTNVTLQCSEDAYEPTLKVLGEKSSNVYEMILTSRCACPDLCHSNEHLSAGSVLVIIFLTFLSLYLILGIVHSSLTRGAHGWELIPHYEFWADFPLLVRDGFVFVLSGCKPETAYERI